jgi:quercetin dioxygenase-like cupin family protein
MLACFVWIGSAQQQPSGSPPGGNFTGGPVETLTPEGRLSYYVFSPGARTKWHSHEGGQLILVEEGVGRTQQRGGPVRDLRTGDTAWAPRGVAHWHGSAPGQNAKLYQVSRGATTWMEDVADADYNAGPGR